MSAACAETIEFKLVGLDGKAVPRGHFLLQPLDVVILEFHDLSA